MKVGEVSTSVELNITAPTGILMVFSLLGEVWHEVVVGWGNNTNSVARPGGSSNYGDLRCQHYTGFWL